MRDVLGSLYRWMVSEERNELNIIEQYFVACFF